MALATTIKSLTIGSVVGVCLALGGCGGDADEDGSGAAPAAPDTAAGEQEAAGGGTATLTVGDDVYTFDTVMCAIGSDQTGNEDWDFSLSAIQDGLQLSVETGPTYGDGIELDDIEDFENPRVGWASDGDGFLAIDDGDVSASTTFIDSTSDVAGDPVAGELVASCP